MDGEHSEHNANTGTTRGSRRTVSHIHASIRVDGGESEGGNKAKDTQRANMITVTTHEANEWRRMATAARAAGLWCLAASAEHHAGLIRVPFAVFDALQAEHRAWLVRGFDRTGRA